MTGADKTDFERILYVDLNRNPSLLLSFVEPLKASPTIDTHHLLENEFDVTGTTSKSWPNDPVAIEQLESRLRELAPTLIVFCRYSGPYARAIVEWARSAKVPTIYHIDDNLLNVPQEIGIEKARSHNAPRRVSTVRYLLDETTVAYCSNEPLRRVLFGDRQSSRVIAGDIYCSSEIMGSPTTDEPPVIGYMGFGSHDHDFTFAVPAIVRILDSRPDVAFELFGNLALPEPLERFGARIRKIEPVREYARFRQKLASVRWTIGICPLADTPFNKVKSNTKWVEYTASGFAVVASSNSIYEMCCADGCGMLAANDEEWYSALDSLLTDKALHRTQVERAQRRVRESYSPDRLRRQILSVFTHAHELATGLRTEEQGRASDAAALQSKPASAPPSTTSAARSEAEKSTRLALDRLKGSRIQGWAFAPGETAEDAAKSPVELWCGDLLVGRLSRRLNRPDVDAHLGTAAWPKGFLLPARSVNALGLLLGGEKGALPPTIRFGGATKSTLSGGRYLSDLGAHPTLRSAQATHGWKIEDIWWANSHLLKVRAKHLPLEANRAGAKSVHVFQPCREANGRTRLVEVDEFSIDERAGVYPFGVRNPMMPILLVAYDAAGEISFSDLMPFPSLLRGGMHEAEVAACGEQGGSLSDCCCLSDAYLAEAIGFGNDAVPPAVAEISVDLLMATGAESIFDNVMREWLSCVFNVVVNGQNREARVQADLGDETFSQHIDKLLSEPNPIEPRRGRLRLSLPACAIPTVGVLASRQFSSYFSGAPAPFILVDEANPQHRRFSIAFPGDSATNTLRALNCGSAGFPTLHTLGQALGQETESSQPTAILVRDFSPVAKETLLFPVPKDDEHIGKWPEGRLPVKVSVFIRLFAPNLDIRLLLGSLATQVLTAAVEIILVTASCDANEHANYQQQLADICPKDARIVRAATSLNAADAMNKAVESSSGDIFVFIDHACVLHDQRTLETITRIASTEGVGTVGCMTLRSRSASDSTPVFASAGYFPSRLDFMVAPHVALAEIDCSISLQDAVYAVAANSASFIALSADAWRRVKGFDVRFTSGSFEIDLAARLADAGLINLCTTHISIFTDSKAKLPVGVPDTSHLGVWRLFRALKSSTILRSF